MSCGLRRCEFGRLIQAKPSNHCVTTALENGIRPWTSVGYLSQFTARIRNQERPIAFPDTEAIGRAADGPDAARTKGHSRSTTVAQAFVTSTYVSAGRAKGTTTRMEKAHYRMPRVFTTGVVSVPAHLPGRSGSRNRTQAAKSSTASTIRSKRME